MATRAENLQTALDGIAAKLADMSANPKPDYSVDGESYSWAGLFQMLVAQQKELEQALQRASGPFEVRSRGAM